MPLHICSFIFWRFLFNSNIWICRICPPLGIPANVDYIANVTNTEGRWIVLCSIRSNHHNELPKLRMIFKYILWNSVTFSYAVLIVFPFWWTKLWCSVYVCTGVHFFFLFPPRILNCTVELPWNNRICTLPALKLAYFYHGPQVIPEANRRLTFFRTFQMDSFLSVFVLQLKYFYSKFQNIEKKWVFTSQRDGKSFYQIL